MKRLFLPAFLLLAIAATAANAQKSVRLSSAPSAFKAFYTKFRAAAAKGDKQAVASMTAFPFQYGFDAGDEGTWTRTQFIKNFAKIFGDETDLFAQADPAFDFERGTFGLTNENQHRILLFEKRGPFIS